MAGKFEIFLGKDQQFYFHLKAGNGEKILASEGYKQKASAYKGIESVKRNAPDDARYERKTSNNDKPFFVLKATNGEVIGTSQLYSANATREHGIEAVKQNAPSATIVDLVVVH